MTEQEPRTIRKIRSITLLLAAAAFMAVVSGGSGFVVQAVPGAPIADNAAGGDDGGAKGSVWVVNRDLGELAIFDAETGDAHRKAARWERERTTSASRRKPARPISPPRQSMRSRR